MMRKISECQWENYQTIKRSNSLISECKATHCPKNSRLLHTVRPITNYDLIKSLQLYSPNLNLARQVFIHQAKGKLKNATL